MTIVTRALGVGTFEKQELKNNVLRRKKIVTC
jgi:hypothetical protein